MQDPATINKLISEVLSATMSGEITWSMPEALYIRKEIERHKILKENSFGQARKIHSKVLKRLRRRLRNLSHENASVFTGECNLLIPTPTYSMSTPALYNTIKIEIEKEIVFLSVRTRRNHWGPIVEVSSDDYPVLITLPFLIRRAETTKFHKESKYANDDEKE